MLKKRIILIFLFLIIVLLLFLLIQYKKPYNIEESFNVFNLDGIYINTNLDTQNYKHLEYLDLEYEVEVSFLVKRNMFKNYEFTGSLTLNGIEYTVLIAQKQKFLTNKHSIFFVKKDDIKPGVAQSVELVVLQKNDFQTIIIMVPNEDMVLVGPAKTIEEAILKYEKYFY